MAIDKRMQRRYLTIAVVAAIVIALVRLVSAIAGASSTSASSVPPPQPIRGQGGGVSPATLPPAGSGGVLLRLDVLKEINERPLPELTRNPFEFGPTPEEMQKAEEAKKLADNPPPPPPPAPPPVPFKAMGFQQDAKGRRVAYLSDEQETYIVHEGEEFGQRFKVLKITDASVEVQDETYHQIVQLPYPQ
jgi:hypothetical protein